MKIISEITGTVWKLEVQPGQTVAAGDNLLIVESMKMEIPVTSESAGRVDQIFVAEGDLVEDGQVLMTLG